MGDIGIVNYSQVLIVGAGGVDGMDESGLRFIQKPVVQPNPNTAAPLVALVTFKVNRSVTTTARISDGRNRWELSFDNTRVPEQGLPIVGCRPDRRHEITLTIEDSRDGRIVSDALVFHTPKLPSDPAEFPDIHITKNDAVRVEPGFRLFNPRRRITRSTQLGNSREQTFGEAFGMLLMVDQQGEVVWYYRTESRIAGFEYVQNGHILYVTADYRLVEIDLAGNKIRSWYAEERPQGGDSVSTPVKILTIHHDAGLLPNGNLLALSSERRQVENYYTDEYDSEAAPASRWVMGDRAVEFTPDGHIVWEWHAFEHLPVMRIGYETYTKYWERRGFSETADWSHANGITELEDGSVLINFRIQSAVIKIDKASGEIIWIFGEATGWPSELQEKVVTLEGAGRWFWHQHAPVITARGTLLLFDNGNYRARPFDEPTPVAETWSRAVEYEVDEKSLTARQVWSSETADEDRYVTLAMGSVSELPSTGNVLVGYGAVLDPEHVKEISWRNRFTIGQITACKEYTRDNPAEVVWELRLKPTGTEPKIGWNIFGCTFVKTLHS